MSAKSEPPFILAATRRGQKGAARKIAGWARQLASEYEQLAAAEVAPSAVIVPLTEEEIGQKMQSHDQYVGAAAAMHAMVEKIEGEFSL